MDCTSIVTAIGRPAAFDRALVGYDRIPLVRESERISATPQVQFRLRALRMRTVRTSTPVISCIMRIAKSRLAGMNRRPAVRAPSHDCYVRAWPDGGLNSPEHFSWHVGCDTVAIKTEETCHVLQLRRRRYSTDRKNVRAIETADVQASRVPSMKALTRAGMKVETILAPTDLSIESKAGVRYALHAARELDARVVVHYVITTKEIAAFGRSRRKARSLPLSSMGFWTLANCVYDAF
jgi:hypothetical protein